MDRKIALKLAAAFGIFAILFLCLWTLGGMLIGALLPGAGERAIPADFPEDGKAGPGAAHGRSLLSPHDSPGAPTGDPRAAVLVARLASPDYGERKAAEDGLVALGNAAVPDLEQAQAHADPEVRWRAKEALRRIREAPGR